MGRCALILRQGRVDWPLRLQYDKVAGYCHVRKLEIRKIYIDPTDLSVAEIRHDAQENDFDMVLVADRSLAAGVLPSDESWCSLSDLGQMKLVAVSE
ncbi:MAG: hypothetical protein ACM3ZQ_00980 [Bacillota bacterium]